MAGEKNFRIMHLRRGYIGESTAERAYDASLLVVVVALPWAMIAPHEKQAQNNHSQSLMRLNERGGLDAGEALAVLEDRDYWPGPAVKDEEAHAKLYALLMEYIEGERRKYQARLEERDRNAQLRYHPPGLGQIEHM